MAADIAAVRELTGSTPDDATITTVWARFDDATHQVERTALSILRTREADMIEGPDSWATDGDYREARAKAATLKALAAKIARLESITGDTTGAANVLTSAAICAPEGLR